MRKIFIGLVVLNLVLFAWLRGWFGTYPVSGREPARLEQQIAAERIRVVTDSEVQQLERRARDTKAAPPSATASSPESVASCLETGEFSSDAQLVRLRDKLAELKLADRSSELVKDRPGWYLVYLPAEKTQADADKRAEQLRAQGLRDVLVMKEEGALHFAIGLGSFRDRDLARKQVTLLERRGVKGARVADNPTTVRSTRIQVRGAEAPAIRQLEEALKEFPQQKLQPCAPESPS
jgi:hypothetical protein